MKSVDKKDLKMDEFIYKELSYEIIGACMEVHNVLGPGFLEAVYQEALEKELKNRNIPYQREKTLDIEFKGELLDTKYKADFICYDKIILETKALSSLISDHEAQLLNYLKATKLKLGFLINFGEKSLIYKRFIFSED